MHSLFFWTQLHFKLESCTRHFSKFNSRNGHVRDFCEIYTFSSNTGSIQPHEFHSWRFKHSSNMNISLYMCDKYVWLAETMYGSKRTLFLEKNLSIEVVFEYSTGNPLHVFSISCISGELQYFIFCVWHIGFFFGRNFFFVRICPFSATFAICPLLFLYEILLFFIHLFQLFCFISLIRFAMYILTMCECLVSILRVFRDLQLPENRRPWLL